MKTKTLTLRPRPLQAPQRAHPAPAVQDPHPGRDRLPRHRLGEHLRATQGRPRQVLRRRRLAEEEAAEEAGGGQEEDEEHRERQRAPGGVHGGPEHEARR